MVLAVKSLLKFDLTSCEEEKNFPGLSFKIDKFEFTSGRGI